MKNVKLIATITVKILMVLILVINISCDDDDDSSYGSLIKADAYNDLATIDSGEIDCYV